MKGNSSLSGNNFFSRCNSIIPADKTVKPPISALIHFLLSLNEEREKEIYCIYLLCALCLGGLHIIILLMSDGPEVAAGLVFNQKMKWVCIAPQLIEFHCLPIAPAWSSSHLCWPTEHQLGLLPPTWTTLCEPTLPLILRVLHMSFIWQSCPYRHGNPGSWYTLLFSGGTTSQTLSQQVRPSRPSTSSWRSSSSNSTCSRNGTYLSPPSFSPVYYPFDSLSIALQVS